MKRTEAASIAAETLGILNAGHYINAQGDQVEIGGPVAACIAGTQLITPGEWGPIVDAAAQVVAQLPGTPPPTVEVTAETTLAASYRLADERPLVLNFASANNPGGGFLGGSRAQEESLARSSALYPSLLKAAGYYAANRQGPRAIYTDHAIFSPAVPVFRHDDGSFLDAPFTANFVTMPAVNAKAMKDCGNYDQGIIVQTLTRRIGYVLALGVARGFQSIILGAWGCGAFGNEAGLVAALFADAIRSPVAGWYKRITFAVYDSRTGQPALAAFKSLER